MPSQKAEQDYEYSRTQINRLISRYGKFVRKYLDQISAYKAEACYEFLMGRWHPYVQSRYGENRDFASIPDDIQDRITAAYVDYTHYVFFYRFGYDQKNNAKFRKITSFELHFFKKHRVIERGRELTRDSVMALQTELPDMRLLVIDPITHFFMYKIVSEARVRKPADHWEIGSQATETFEIIDTVTSSLLEFAVAHMSATDIDAAPPLDAFRAFLKQPNSAHLNHIIDEIDTESPADYL